MSNYPNIDWSLMVLPELGGIMDAAERQMPDFYYHNWGGHILYSLDFAMGKCDQYDRGGRVSVDRLAVATGVCFHDTGNGKATDEFSTDEVMGGHIAGQELTDLGYPEEFITIVQNGIGATALDGVPKTNEEKLTCMADVSNVFTSYADMTLNAFRFYRETLEKEPLSFKEYRARTNKILQSLLAKDLVIDEVIDLDEQGRPVYEQRGLKHLNRFMHASSQQLTRTLGEHASRYVDLIPSPSKRGMDLILA